MESEISNNIKNIISCKEIHETNKTFYFYHLYKFSKNIDSSDETFRFYYKVDSECSIKLFKICIIGEEIDITHINNTFPENHNEDQLYCYVVIDNINTLCDGYIKNDINYYITFFRHSFKKLSCQEIYLDERNNNKVYVAQVSDFCNDISDNIVQMFRDGKVTRIDKNNTIERNKRRDRLKKKSKNVSVRDNNKKITGKYYSLLYIATGICLTVLLRKFFVR